MRSQETYGPGHGHKFFFAENGQDLRGMVQTLLALRPPRKYYDGVGSEAVLFLISYNDSALFQ
jgi:hypothetical protein